MMRCLRLLPLLFLVVLVAACGRGRHQDKTEYLPVDQMYEIAHQALNNGNYERAIRFYQRLVARFPFGLYTEQAQLELAYAQYRSKKHDEAVSTIDRFLKTYPTHAKADYAQYLRGIANFYREASLLGRYIDLDPAVRDLNSTRQSFTDFAKLLRDYPDSRYAADARQRMVYLRNTLARHEVMVAAYYLRRHAYIAAINRCKYVLENYQQAPEVGDALALMVEAYENLGERQLADDTRRVLALNYPDHPFITEGRSVVERKSAWRRLVPFG